MRSSNSVADNGPKRWVVGDGIGLPLAGKVPKQVVIALLLFVALFAFEIFNFDTTRFAMQSLLGDVNFIGLRWATILAIAFCAIDFAGLAHLFTPEKGLNEPKEIWYLMGAWLLGATMNAIMTWWAVSLTLLSHDFGNEVLGRETLLQVVPIFVAVLVWLTRILFIGAISVAGDGLFNLTGTGVGRPAAARTAAARTTANAVPRVQVPQTEAPRPTTGARMPARSPVPRPMGASGGASRPSARPAAMSGPRAGRASMRAGGRRP